MRRARTAAVTAAVTLMTAAGVAGAVPHAAATTSTHYTIQRDYDYYSKTTKVVRWDPCHKIPYRINVGTTSSTTASYRVSLVKKALARVTAATAYHRSDGTVAPGISFYYLGRTSYIPHNTNGMFNGYQQFNQTGARLVIGWAYQSQSNLFQLGEAGVGGGIWASTNLNQMRILAGFALIKKGVSLKGGFLPGGSTGTLLLHEIGHAMGLKHYLTDPTQLMYPILTGASPAGYGAGDHAGLQRVGRPAGCMSTKAPPMPRP